MPLKQEVYIRHQLDANYTTDTEGTDAPAFTHSLRCAHSGPVTGKCILWPECQLGVPCGAGLRSCTYQTESAPSPETSHFQVGPRNRDGNIFINKMLGKRENVEAIFCTVAEQLRDPPPSAWPRSQGPLTRGLTQSNAQDPKRNGPKSLNQSSSWTEFEKSHHLLRKVVTEFGHFRIWFSKLSKSLLPHGSGGWASHVCGWE